MYELQTRAASSSRTGFRTEVIYEPNRNEKDK